MFPLPNPNPYPWAQSLPRQGQEMSEALSSVRALRLTQSTGRSLAKHRPRAPLPPPRALPAAGRVAGGDILHKALLHARDPGRAVGMVGCQHHAARVLHLHGHRHMSAPLLATEATRGAGEGPCHKRRPMAWPGGSARHCRLSAELWHRDTAPLPVSEAGLA